MPAATVAILTACAFLFFSSSAGAVNLSGGIGQVADTRSVPERIMEELMSRGIERAAAAGITGNALQESSWNPASEGMGGGGLWGFTSPPVSLDDLRRFARKEGQSWKSVSLQTRFLLRNLNIHDSRFRNKLNSIRSPERAATVFCWEWERPARATANLARRQEGARRAWKMSLQVRPGLGGVQGTGVSRSELRKIRSHIYAGHKVSPGRHEATAYGPPWNAMQGSGITSTGISLGKKKKRYLVAIDPQEHAYGTLLRIWPNPFRWRGPFVAADTGGAIVGKRIDFYDWRGRKKQYGWGRRGVRVSDWMRARLGGGVSPNGCTRLYTASEHLKWAKRHMRQERIRKKARKRHQMKLLCAAGPGHREAMKKTWKRVLRSRLPANHDLWIRIGRCEQPGSGYRGVYWSHPGPTYQGGLGFWYGTWDSFKYRGMPANAGQATWRQQMRVANRLLRQYGTSPWGCA